MRAGGRGGHSNNGLLSPSRPPFIGQPPTLRCGRRPARPGCAGATAPHSGVLRRAGRGGVLSRSRSLPLCCRGAAVGRFAGACRGRCVARRVRVRRGGRASAAPRLAPGSRSGVLFRRLCLARCVLAARAPGASARGCCGSPQSRTVALCCRGSFVVRSPLLVVGVFRAPLRHRGRKRPKGALFNAPAPGAIFLPVSTGKKG